MVRHGQEERTWWSRNWGWVVGCGCLLIVGLPAACTALVGVLGYGYFRSATPVNEILERVRSDPRVVEALGEPIEWSWFNQPGAEIRVDEDRAEVELHLTGPRGSGSVHALVDRRGEDWAYRMLEVRVEGRDRPIDLLSEAEPAPGDAAEPDPAGPSPGGD